MTDSDYKARLADLMNSVPSRRIFPLLSGKLPIKGNEIWKITTRPGRPDMSTGIHQASREPYRRRCAGSAFKGRIPMGGSPGISNTK